MMINLANLHADPANARRAAEDEASIRALADSLLALGQLQPIIVRPGDGDGAWLVTAGARRVAAARHLGWTEIAAVMREDDPALALAVSTAENTSRKAMGPVDQWRAIAAICADQGFTVERAAAALSIDLTLTKRLNLLGRMAPEVIAAIEAENSLPGYQWLRAIATAPHDAQLAALSRATRQGGVSWQEVANLCRCPRIPAARAAFDTATSAVVFEEDLFAEPGSDEAVTTRDIAGFLKAQQAALEAMVKASKGRYEIIDAPDPNSPIGASLPKGWRQTFERDIPKRWRKDDERRVFCGVMRSGYNIGAIEHVIAEPLPDRKAKRAENGLPAEAAPRPIAKVTLARLAEIKGDAVRERLRVFARNGTHDMLHALLLAFTFDNLRSPHGEPDVARTLVDADGQPKSVTAQELCDLAATIIGRLITFDRPDYFGASGRGAEWLALAIGAEVGRCDTEEVLRGFPLEKLSEIAVANGLAAHGTATQLRKRMVGQMPDWRPAQFGAFGPFGAAGTQEDTEEQEDETDMMPYAGTTADEAA